MTTRVEATHPADWTLPTPAHLGLVARVRPFLRALFRFGVGLLFMQHGLQKIFGLLGGAGPDGGTVPLMSLMGLAGVLELVGGLLIAIGFLTRPVAFLLAGEMMYAFLMVHAPQGGWPVQNHGELPLLYALAFGYLLGDGAGPMSVDAAIERSRRHAHEPLPDRA
jgi:putative oxidoreductase